MVNHVFILFISLDFNITYYSKIYYINYLYYLIPPLTYVTALIVLNCIFSTVTQKKVVGSVVYFQVHCIYFNCNQQFLNLKNFMPPIAK